MALFSQTDLIAGIPEITQLVTLDDDGDQIADVGVFDSVLAEATDWIEGYLEQAGLSIPSTVPKRLKHLGVKYAEYTLWRRRGHSERMKELFDNWLKPGAAYLEKVSRGEESLAADSAADTTGTVISEPARTHDEAGRMMA